MSIDDYELVTGPYFNDCDGCAFLSPSFKCAFPYTSKELKCTLDKIYVCKPTPAPATLLHPMDDMGREVAP